MIIISLICLCDNYTHNCVCVCVCASRSSVAGANHNRNRPTVNRDQQFTKVETTERDNIRHEDNTNYVTLSLYSDALQHNKTPPKRFKAL